MNLQEFAALKVGDKIENAMLNSAGVVSEVTDAGVRIAWNGASGITYLYTTMSTAWMHWNKVEPGNNPETIADN